MNKLTLNLAAAVAFASGVAQAAGPLYTSDGDNPQPFRWKTTNGPIPVYTDGGEAYTFDFDGVTPFVSIEQANEVTAFAFNEWSKVPTSTFSAEVAGTIEEQLGISDVTAENAAELYEQQNGYGIWVIYDTEGDILEEYFGVPKSAVLGIAFPEWTEADGEIIEATALMNGWAVSEDDPDLYSISGVFTHEFGHALNLSHSQVNGPMVYQSTPFSPQHPGVKGCTDPVYRFDLPAFYGPGERANPALNETMFPFISAYTQGGAEQSTVNMPDDIAGISNLYPTVDYKATTGSITGVIRLKDGITEYSGMNVIARNVNDPMGDAVSDMSGSATQGKLGPDGRFTINNLTPGEQYVLYFEQITSGGYPTTQTRYISEQEYWNANEGTDPLVDNACDATPILAEAGVTKQADFYFNGYQDGVQYTPLVDAFLVDLSKNGKVAAGVAGTTAFQWEEGKGFRIFPSDFGTIQPAIDRNGSNFLVGGVDLDGNGIGEAAIYHWGKGLTLLGDMNGNSCGGSGQTGTNASTGWAMNDAGNKAVGTAYVDVNDDGDCQDTRDGEIQPFVWTEKTGMQTLPVEGLDLTRWVRAHAISGNGEVILGNNGGSRAVAWVDGEMVDLASLVDGYDAYASNYDGTQVAVATSRDGVILWDHTNEAEPFQNIGGPAYCFDIPLANFFGDFCAQDFNNDGLVDHADWEMVNENSGVPFTMVTDMSDDGSFMVARTGNGRTGFHGVLWFKDLGWVMLNDFLEQQGVVEARRLGMDNPYSLSAQGKQMVGGLAGVQSTWYVNMEQAYVCEDGQDALVGFPNGYVSKVKGGALPGRCGFVAE